MIKKLINSKLGQQIIKFGAVGFLCFFIEYVLLILFKELLGWPVIAANTLAFTVSAIVNYILSILFVFDTDKKANQSKQFAVFFILAVGGLILNNVVLKLDICGQKDRQQSASHRKYLSDALRPYAIDRGYDRRNSQHKYDCYDDADTPDPVDA